MTTSPQNTASLPLPQRILNLLVFSNLYVATPVTCLAWTTYWIWEVPTNYRILGFVYCATLFLYSFHRMAGLHRIPATEWNQRHAWAARNKPFMYALTGAAGLAAALLFWAAWGNSQPRMALYLLVPAAIIALGYALPVLRWRGRWLRLRDLPFIKIGLIALVVTAVTLWLPLSDQWWLTFDMLVGLPFWVAYSLQRFLFLLAITIPFDVRDLEADQRAGLRTLPTVLGAKRALRLANRLLLASAVMAVLPYGFMPMRDTLLLMVALLIGVAGAWLVVRLSHQQRSEYFFSLGVEGTMILQWLAYGAVMLLL